MPKITRLEIKDYRGIRDLSINVPPEGAVFSGGNGRGKSSALKAITAVLAGKGIEPEAIRLGADHAEILIDTEALRVRRSITAKGSSLTVKNADGDNWSKPQTRLNELFGTAALDALSFFLAEPKERRRILLEALPVSVTPEDVERWAPGARMLERISLDGHGLEVLERMHQLFYTIRTEVNKTAKAARAEADAAASYPPAPDVALSVDEATAAHVAAGQRLAQLQAREMAAVEAKKGAESTRQLIAQAEARAQLCRDAARGAPTDEQLEAAIEAHDAAVIELRRLEDAIHVARTTESETNAARGRIVASRERAARTLIDAQTEDKRAAELRASMAPVDAMGVPAEELAGARTAVDQASAALTDATAADTARQRAELHGRLEATATKREGDAAEIDAIVKRLANEAPQELAARASVPGLGINGDVITLDGVSLSDLSGAEQMRFAVDLCKRLNAKAKILVVDGLERLDDDSLDAFVKFATADGFQLIGTRVSSGELVVEALSPQEEGAHAA